jgi:rhodanese-related sulfurtransferase
VTAARQPRRSDGVHSEDVPSIDRTEETTVRTITREELIALLDADAPIRLVMALGPGRFTAAHIPGSETFTSVEEGLAALSPADDIVVYCTGGHASILACRLLEQHGYRHVRRYAGGLADWDAAGLPLDGDGVLTGCAAA